MEEHPISVQKDGEVSTIFLQRPERMNTLTGGMLDALECEVARLREDRSTRVVLIRGRGRAFCAGVEMKGVTYNPLNAKVFLEKLNRVLRDLERLPQPTVAMIHGACVAGGLELALACTFRIAAIQSKMGLPETGLGLVAAAGTTYRLPRLVGFGKALELTLLGTLIDGKEAEAIGLVTRAVDESLLVETGWNFAEKLKQKAPLAMSFIKDAFCLNVTPHRETANMLEILFASVNHYSQDKIEGLTAFFEKRPPRFKGE